MSGSVSAPPRKRIVPRVISNRLPAKLYAPFTMSRPPVMTGSVVVPPIFRSISHSESRPMPDTNSWFCARTRMFSLIGAAGARGRSIGRSGDANVALAAHARQFGHFGLTLADDFVPRVGDAQVALDQPAALTVGDVQRTAGGGAQRIALGELRIVERHADVGGEAAVRREADAALRLDGAVARLGAEVGQHQGVVAEARGDLHLAQPGAVRLVVIRQIVGADQPGELRRGDAAREIGGDRDRPRQLLVGQRRQAEQRRGRAVVADAARQRGVHQPRRPRSRAGRQRIHVRDQPTHGVGPALDDRARLSAVGQQLADELDIHRLRNRGEPGALKIGDGEPRVRLWDRGALLAIVEAAGGLARQAEARARRQTGTTG